MSDTSSSQSEKDAHTSKVEGGDTIAAPKNKAKKKKERKKKSFLRHGIRLFLESVAALLGVSLLAIVTLGWFISKGPISADYLLPYIQRALNDVQGQMNVSIGSLQLEWHGWQSPVGLKAYDLVLSNNYGPFLDIRQASLDVSISDLLQENMQLKDAVIKGVQARVVKQPDGSIRLFKDERETYGPVRGSTPLTVEKIVDNLPPIHKLMIENAHLEYFDAQKGVVQEVTNVELSINQNNLDDTQNKDVFGYLTFVLGGQQTENKVSLDFMYNPLDKNLSLSGRLGSTDIYSLAHFFELDDAIDDKDIVIDVPLQAKTNAVLSSNWKITHFELRAQTKEGSLTVPQVPKKTLAIGSLNMALSYDPVAKKIALYETAFSIEDMNFNLQADLQLPIPENGEKFEGHIKSNLEMLKIDSLNDLVPHKFSHEPLYKWMVERISAGHFTDIAFNADVMGEKFKKSESNAVNNNSTVADTARDDAQSDGDVSYVVAMVRGKKVPLPPRKPIWTNILQEEIDDETFYAIDDVYAVVAPAENFEWKWDIANTVATFDYDGLKVDYKQPMAPADNVKGTGKLNGKTLKLDIASATIGGMKARKGYLFFDDLVTKGKGTATIKLDIDTDLASAFDFLSKDPINFGKNLTLDMKKSKGRADLDVNIDFPTVKDLLVKDIHVKAQGTMHDVTLPGVLKGMSLTGGPYSIFATQNEYNMKGKGKLDGRDIAIDWHSYFSEGKKRPYESRIKASFIADKSFRKKIGVNLSDFLEGSVPVSIDLQENWDKSSILDVSGLVNRAVLKIEPFEYATSNNNAGKVNARVNLMKGKLQSIENLQIKTNELSVKDGELKFSYDSLVSDMRITNAKFENISFLQNDFGLKLEETQDGIMKLALDGRQVDARHFLAPTEKDKKGSSVEKEKNQKFEIGLNVQHLLTVDDESIANVEAYIKGQTGKINQLELDGVAGKGSIYLRYKPNMEDDYSLRIESDDAGALLKAIGVTDKVRGGKITVAGLPLNTGYYGDVRGLARIDDFNVRAAPAFAGILKLMDLPTVMTTMNDDGLSFARLETEFEWRNRKGGGIISFKDGRTSGGSIGLTFEGDINKTANIVAIAGTIVPASTLNSFFSGIPLIGDILSGGSGSIFAATYSMKGSTEEPETNVNPLSVLAPGLLRRLLFEGGE